MRGGRLELHLHDALKDLLAVGRTLRREPGQVDDGVPPTRHALVELDDDGGQSRTLPAHVVDRLDHVVGGADVLGPDRVLHTDLTEQPPTSGLRPELGEARVRAVHRDAEDEGQVTFELRGVVGHEVGALRVRDRVRDPAQEAWSGQQLLAQRRRRRVADRHQAQARPGMAGNDAREEGQVVLHDCRRDRHRRHVDHPQLGLSEQEQQEQEAFLVGLVEAARIRNVRVAGDGGDDHHGLVRVVHPDRLPSLRHPGLQPVEELVALGLVQLTEGPPGRLGDGIVRRPGSRS